jgi:transcriptional regulator GlxA family with amidase domain
MLILRTAESKGEGVAMSPPPTRRRRLHRGEVWDRLQRYTADPTRKIRLCKEVGVTERTLRSICRQYAGVSCHAYITLRRLLLAHNLLHNSDPATASITRVAMVCGFTELGRFSVAYRKLFGQSPSVTLREASNRQAGSV